MDASTFLAKPAVAIGRSLTSTAYCIADRPSWLHLPTLMRSVAWLGESHIDRLADFLPRNVNRRLPAHVNVTAKGNEKIALA